MGRCLWQDLVLDQTLNLNPSILNNYMAAHPFLFFPSYQGRNLGVLFKGQFTIQGTRTAARIPVPKMGLSLLIPVFISGLLAEI